MKTSTKNFVQINVRNSSGNFTPVAGNRDKGYSQRQLKEAGLTSTNSSLLTMLGTYALYKNREKHRKRRRSKKKKGGQLQLSETNLARLNESASSADQSLQEPKIENPSTSHSSVSIRNELTQLEALGPSGGLKAGAKKHAVMKLAAANSDSNQEEEDSADEEANECQYLADESKLSRQIVLGWKRRLEDDSNSGQTSKRRRTNGSAISTRSSPVEEAGGHSSSDSSRSGSPGIATDKVPSVSTIKSKQQGGSVKSRPKAIKLKSNSNKFKSAKYVLSSEDEEVVEISKSSYHNAIENSTDIEKADQSVTQKKPRRLSVQQTVLSSDIEVSHVSPVTPTARKPAKNYILGSRKMGPFDEQEQELFKAFEMRYRTEHGISECQFNEKLHENAHNDKARQAIWNELAQELPGRDRKSIQRFCRRKKPITGIITTPFTEEDDKQLMSLIARYGTVWVKIGQEMDRTADTLRDRYRNVLKDSATRKLWKWSPSEIEELKRAVGATAAKALEEVPDVEDLNSLIVWSSVSQEMMGKRGRAQCSNKWNDLVVKGEVSLEEEINKAEVLGR